MAASSALLRADKVRRVPFVHHAVQLFLACLVAVLIPSHAVGQGNFGVPPGAWAGAGSDITPDPAVTFGQLPNGMRYALMRNPLPPGAAAVRFVVPAGSLQEQDAERGLVHFIEHMAFNGSKRVPEGDMTKALERLGLAFGADVNAVTSRSETVYILDLPDATDAALHQSLFLLREIASELSFDPAALDRERGVMLAEQRRSDTYETRRSAEQLEFLFPGAYVARRPPIGDRGVIETADRDKLASLYQRLYWPERSLIIVAGDISPVEVERKIVDLFTDWTPKNTAEPAPDIAYAIRPRDSEALVFSHPTGGDSIAVYQPLPFERIPDTVATRREAWLYNAAMGIMGRRFARLAESSSPPFRRASMSHYGIWDAVDVVSLSATITPGNWKPALESLEQEWRRALIHGFTEAEVLEQIAWIRAGLKQSVERMNTRTTTQVTTQLLGTLLEGGIFADPRSELARFEAWAPSATTASVHEVFSRRMKVDLPLFLLATSVPQPGAHEEIPGVWEESRRVPVAPPPPRPRAVFSYTNFGPPGLVVADKRLPDIDARLVTFANNVRLNMKKTSFQANTVMVSLRVGEGALGLEGAPPGLASLMTAYVSGGLEEHSVDDLRSMLSGRIVEVSFAARPDSFGGVYSTTPADLELQLQLLMAYILHPGYRPEGERRWRESTVLSLPGLEANAQSVFSSSGVRLLMSGDKRFGSVAADGVTDRSFSQLRTYLEPMLQDGAIEIAVVGDILEDQVISLVARTFGALPERNLAPAIVRSAQPVTFRPPGQSLDLRHAGEPTQAMIQLYWPAAIDPDADPQGARTLSVLGSVMRLKIVASLREQLGVSYAPSAGATVSAIYPGLGHVFARAEVAPQHVETAGAAIRSIASDLRAGRISDDELQRAIQPALEQLPAHATENGYWLALIAQAQGRPERLAGQQVDAVENSIRAVSIPDLVEAARLWLSDANAREVRILPAKPS